jgi:hypothetical protein
MNPIKIALWINIVAACLLAMAVIAQAFGAI